jgi:hypothetical protein
VTRVWSLTHLRPRGSHTEWPLVDVKQIGFFRSEGEARRAARRLRLDPGFRRFLDQFRIEALELDVDRYDDGFDPDADRELVLSD